MESKRIVNLVLICVVLFATVSIFANHPCRKMHSSKDAQRCWKCKTASQKNRINKEIEKGERE